MKIHIHAVHEGHKDYKCESCGKSFTGAQSLKEHINTVHEGLKKYKCISNGKYLSFKYGNDFHNHKKSLHIWCKYCDENFGDSREVNEHIKLIHGISNKHVTKSKIKCKRFKDRALDFEEFVDLDLTKLC